MTERGITLIEVLIALVVLSIALIGAFRLISYQTQSAEAAQERLIAHWVAENHLAELTLSGPPLKARDETKRLMGGTGWTVQVKTDPVEDGFAVEVKVSADGKAGALAHGFIRGTVRE